MQHSPWTLARTHSHPPLEVECVRECLEFRKASALTVGSHDTSIYAWLGESSSSWTPAARHCKGGAKDLRLRFRLGQSNERNLPECFDSPKCSGMLNHKESLSSTEPPLRPA